MIARVSTAKRVFISYASKDGLQHATKLKECFKGRGVDAFLEKHDVPLATPQWIRIGEEIKQRNMFVLIGTPAAYNSYGVKLEVSAAINHRKPVVTLKFNNSEIFAILYAPKFDHFENDADLQQLCEKITAQFDYIVEEHRRVLLEAEEEAKKQAQGRPQRFLTTGESTEPKENLEGLNHLQVEKVRASIMSSYESTTVIPSLAGVRSYNSNQDKGKEFSQIYVAFFHPVEDFKRENITVDFFQVGLSVTSGERNFINKEIFNRGPFKEISRTAVTVKAIRQMVSELKKEGFTPNVILAPVNLYVECLENWLKEEPGSLEWDTSSRETFVFDDFTKLRIFWSNNYVKFSDFAILDSACGEWVVKPDAQTGRPLTVRISRSTLYPETRVEVVAKTIVNYQLRRTRGIRILRLK
jgi:hypothetical protein